MSKQQRTYAIDFDGVIHQYDGYKGGQILGPIPGARETINALVDAGHEVVIFTTRDSTMVADWLDTHGFPRLEVTNVKRPFWLIIDDRAMSFNGNWDGMLEKALKFEPYWIKARKGD